MSDAKTLYNAIIDAGISSCDAREFCIEHLSEDPITLDGAVVHLTVEVTVNLDYSDLDGVSIDDDDSIYDAAREKILAEVGSIYGDIQIDSISECDISEKSLDGGELV